MRAAADTFVDVASLTDREVAQRAREMEIDIAVDLKGYTFGSRSGVFAHRAASIQVNYLGYPGTMGAPFIDYIIADRELIADEDRAFFSESLVRLPHTYQPVDTTRWSGQAQRSRAEYGLPAEGLVFCCFNNAFKITPALLDCWARILRATDGAVLWLLGDSDAMIANIGKEAAARGIADRIVFAPRVSMAEHLTRHRAADLFLDCRPCTAHTTASEALLAGLPLLTMKGETFAGRVAASVLRAAGMPELITFSMEEYEAAALRLAHDRAALTALKARLAETRLASPLFDTALYTRHLEDAYRQMCDRHWAGEAPAPFDIAARQALGR
jgi:predicted O-linked N-acetylglucosamine transferase (SPINDLY family)